MPRTSGLALQYPWYSAGLLPELQATLVALADLEVCYQSEHEQLRVWTGPEVIKERLLAQLKDHYEQQREPLVQRLTELQRLMGPRQQERCTGGDMRHISSMLFAEFVLLTASIPPALAQAPAPVAPPADPVAAPAGGIEDWWWVILLVIVVIAAIWYFARRRRTL